VADNGNRADMEKLPLAFYRRDQVLQIATELIGKILVTGLDGMMTAGRIVECEAYNGIVDRASHAWKGRRTARTEVMYSPGGVAYVYLCYGIHHLFNIVTNVKDTPHAILVRALEPLRGMDLMMKRAGKSVDDFSLTRGPGNLSRAMGISTELTGHSLQSREIYIAHDNYPVKRSMIAYSPRIGVDYAGKDASLLYRVFLKGNPRVSGKSS